MPDNISAEIVAKALGGRRAGKAWIARCPVHNDKRPSLSISQGRDGRVLVCCHAGCHQHEVIAQLFGLGLWWATGKRNEYLKSSIRSVRASVTGPNNNARTTMALKIWESSQSIVGSPAEAYLRSRGIIIPLPQSLRYHSGLKHPSGGIWPAMVALVLHGETGVPLAIHRTFIARAGVGKAPVEPVKMMLGPCHGGAVRFTKISGELMVGEGIETCLAAFQSTGKSTWSALSTSGLKSLNLPSIVSKVVVLADGDRPGELAAQSCARRWKWEGRSVRIARPPKGKDFADLLLDNNL